MPIVPGESVDCYVTNKYLAHFTATTTAPMFNSITKPPPRVTDKEHDEWSIVVRRNTQEVLFNQKLSVLMVEGDDLLLVQAGYVAMGEFGVPFVDKMRILGRLVVWYASE